MGRSTTRPEDGIATDKELETAADALWDAIEDTGAFTVECDRFDPILDKAGSEVMTVHMEEGHRDEYSKTRVINAALQSDAPVKLRNYEPNNTFLTFYPTNQGE